MRRQLITVWLVVLVVSAVAGQPPRPVGDEANNFYVFVGAETLEYHFDPRGAEGFAAAGLDINEVGTQGLIGVGWVLASPVRLDLVAGGGSASVDREGVDCSVGRAAAEIHLALYESSWVTVETSALVGAHVVAFEGLPDEEAIPGAEVGLGGTIRLSLLEPLSLMASYHWGQARFMRANIMLSEDEELRVHPTASFQGIRVLLTFDI